jgi:hypothetical protein
MVCYWRKRMEEDMQKSWCEFLKICRFVEERRKWKASAVLMPASS